MPKLTFEQKKSIPRKLRGAGVRRYQCKHCNEWHALPPAFCKDNPDYESNRAKQKAAASKHMKEHVIPKGIAATRIRWEDYTERKVQAFRMANLNKERAAQGLLSGENNPMYGKKHTIHSRIQNSNSNKLAWVNRAKREAQAELMSVTLPNMSQWPSALNSGSQGNLQNGEFGLSPETNVSWDDEFDPFH